MRARDAHFKKETTMKTFKHYLLYLVKCMIFAAFIVWLVSCDDDVKKIRLIQQYEDSIGIAKLNIYSIQNKRDQLVASHLRGDHNSSHSIIKDQSDFDKIYAPIEYMYAERLNRYNRIVDSLKLTLQ